MKTFRIIAISALVLTLLSGCHRSEANREIDGLIETLWKTSPLQMDKDRLYAMYCMQSYMDSTSNKDFITYRLSDKKARTKMEDGTVLRYYQKAMKKLVKEVPSTKVEEGTIVIWHLYNMGYVVKTPSHCFAIDLMHPDAAEIVPYIDFLMITHRHNDHFTDALNQAMISAGKQVLTNWDSEDYQTTNVSGIRDLDMGGIKIHTELTDHNANLRNFVVTYLVDCGTDADNARLYFVGDSWDYKQLNPEGPVDIFVPHIHVGLDVYKAAKKIDPNWVFSSHLLELGHDLKKWRWSYFSGLDVSHELHRENVFVPVWGDRIVYKR